MFQCETSWKAFKLQNLRRQLRITAQRSSVKERQLARNDPSGATQLS